MGCLATKDIRRALLAKGFCEKQGDHAWYTLYVDSKRTTVKTKISHGAIEVDDSLISAMQKQTHLGKKDFLDLINCPLSGEGYLKILRKNSIIP